MTTSSFEFSLFFFQCAIFSRVKLRERSKIRKKREIERERRCDLVIFLSVVFFIIFSHNFFFSDVFRNSLSLFQN